MVNEFPGNSHRAAEKKTTIETNTEPERKVEPVVLSGPVIRRKEPLGRRLRRMFINGDSTSVASYLMRDVLIPALQATVTDMVTQGVERMLYGEVRTPRRTVRSGTSGVGTHISYDSQYRTPRTSAVVNSSRPSVVTPSVNRQAYPSVYKMDQVILATRNDADHVVQKLVDIADQYGQVSVAEFYNLIGQTSQHTDYKYGWYMNDLDNIEVGRAREGWVLLMPQPEVLR